MIRRYCPVCRKRLRYNKSTEEFYCPIEKINQQTKEGCGYIDRNEKFPPKVTKEDRKRILKALGG